MSLDRPVRIGYVTSRYFVNNVKNGSSVALSCGDTVLCMLEFLPYQKDLKLTNDSSEDIKREAMALYRSLEPLEEVHARAVINYIYIAKIEEKLLGRKLAHERVEKFAPSYDKLVHDILHKH